MSSKKYLATDLEDSELEKSDSFQSFKRTNRRKSLIQRILPTHFSVEEDSWANLGPKISKFKSRILSIRSRRSNLSTAILLNF